MVLNVISTELVHNMVSARMVPNNFVSINLVLNMVSVNVVSTILVFSHLLSTKAGKMSVTRKSQISDIYRLIYLYFFWCYVLNIFFTPAICIHHLLNEKIQLKICQCVSARSYPQCHLLLRSTKGLSKILQTVPRAWCRTTHYCTAVHSHVTLLKLPQWLLLGSLVQKESEKS